MTSNDSRARVVVLISGRGSNMSALIAACMDPDYPARIVGVLSNRPDAKGLETAARYDIPVQVVDHRAFPSRQAHDAAMIEALETFEPDILCLAGYMRILTPGFVDRYAGRMINIHPSLLPLFPGLNTHERALAAGMRIHGCTVHFVTEGMDEGPIIAQAAIAIDPDDTPDSLAESVLRAEHRLYPHALRLLAEGKIEPTNGTVTIARDGLADPQNPSGRSAPGSMILISPDGRRG